jgi:hypothetical protein
MTVQVYPNKNAPEYAVKSYKLDSILTKRQLEEIAYLLKAKHDGIIKYHCIYMYTKTDKGIGSTFYFKLKMDYY